MKLQDLASVRSGLVLSRKQAKEASEYRYPLINLRCIQQEGTIQLKEADIYEAKAVSYTHLTLPTILLV
mgnify:CR=1 FL=1